LGNTAEPRVAYNDGDGTWPELGFAIVCRWEREREKRERFRAPAVAVILL
jgi:hypothetical protein